jgi:hypothetical protein
MNNRFLIIVGTVVSLGVGGCVGADQYGGASYRSYEGDPWYHDKHLYSGYGYPYYLLPDYYYDPGYRHRYPVIIDKRPHGRYDHRGVIEKTPDGRHDYKKGLHGDGYRHKYPGDRQWRGEDRWRKFHDRDKEFTRPHRGLKCSGPRC